MRTTCANKILNNKKHHSNHQHCINHQYIVYDASNGSVVFVFNQILSVNGSTSTSTGRGLGAQADSLKKLAHGNANPPAVGNANAPGPDDDPPHSHTLAYMRSEDDGVTWTKPKLIDLGNNR